jgi:hypothetical protein
MIFYKSLESNMFEDIEPILRDFLLCELDEHEIFQNEKDLLAIDLYWDRLEHQTKVDFLTSFLKTNFYYRGDNISYFKKPMSVKLSELKKILVTFEEFRIIIQLILNNNLTGTNIEEILLSTRKEGFDDELKNEIQQYPIIPTFMTKFFCTQLINGNSKNIDEKIQKEVVFFSKLLNTVKSYDELIEKLQYYIYIAYYHFIAKYSNTQITQLINKNLVSNVFKYNSDIKRILQEKDKKSFFKQLIHKPQILLDKNL